MSRFGDALVLGPDLLGAAETAVRRATAGLDGDPDLLCLFVSGDDPDQVEAAARRAMAGVSARVVIGCSAGGVIGGSDGVEDEGAVSAWAAVLPGARLEPFRLETLRVEDAERLVIVGMPENAADDAVAMLFTDPYTFPADAFVERTTDVLPGLPFVGGLADGPERGSVRLFLDGEVHADGAVGLLVGGDVSVTTLLSQGARPIGPAMAVTGVEHNMLLELAGTPALDKLEEIVEELPEEDRELAARGLMIGVAIDEYADEHELGDFLVRGVVGADTDTGGIAIGDVVELGRTVRFQVRDAQAADRDLAELLAGFAMGPVEGALLFTCNGRGRAMFGGSDHDVKIVRRTLGARSIGGFFAAGEIGPVGGRNHVHGFTASILAFGGTPDD